MVLDFEYGINTGNRFLDFVDHDEDPEEFIARQAQEEKSKKSAKDSKTVTATTTTKKTTTKPTTTTASTIKTNKENFTGKSTGNDQRRQQTNVLSDNVNQQTRVDSGRGGGRGYPRRGGSTGQDRQPYEGGSRGGNQQRSQRFNKYEGQQQSNETGGFEQSVESWGNETSNDNQTFSGYRGRGRGGGRGRGNYEGGRGGGNYEGGRGRGNYEGGRGGGRGRGGRGNFNNRNFEEGSQQQQTGDSSFDDTRPQTARTPGQELDTDVPAQERPFESGSQRGQGQFRSRTFHNNRGYGGGRQHQYDREGGQDEYRQNRRQHDRQPRSNTSTVKPVEKKDGEGAHNWGSATENFEENPVTDETAETTGQTTAAPKNWSEQVDEAEEQRLLDEQKKQMTLDEYKKQLEEKKRAAQEKVPQLNRRVANEGVDPKQFKEFEQEYRKKNEGEESDEEVEEGSGEEENESEEESVGKKKIITIPLHFKPIEMPGSGPFGSRGGARRGSGRFRPNRDDQTRSKSPTQQQSASYQQTGEYQNDEQFQQQQQSRPYRGGPRGSGRGEYRRSYGNSNRGSRGSYNRSNASSNTPDFDNTVDFPTLPKQ